MPRVTEENWKNVDPSLTCIEDDEMFIHSDDNNFSDFAYISIELEHCSTNSEITCATDEEMASHWADEDNSVTIGLVLSHSQIQMSNIT